MTKTILAVFAHPDDESFGPGGTLAKLAQNNRVLVVSVTAGEACSGMPKGMSQAEIKKLRISEMNNAAHALGVHGNIVLDYPDSKLSNSMYPHIGADIHKIILNESVDTLMTFEPLGFSGHLDHMAVTSIVNSLYHTHDSVTSLLMYGLSKQQRNILSHYTFAFKSSDTESFVSACMHMPHGYDESSLSLSVNISEFKAQKHSAIKAYKSQKNDRDFWQPLMQEQNSEYFIIEGSAEFARS